MPKGRGSNARRRSARAKGHENDVDYQDRRAQALARGVGKLESLYARARKRFERGRS